MKSILFLLLVLFTAPIFSQQLCQGNLGENIFLDGNFGVGPENVLLKNPGIAPGYQYVTSVPFDGQYSLAHNTSYLANLFPSWLHVGDRTDVNGYIMVVNASFLPGIFYEEQITGLCPNTQYEFSAEVINLIKSTITDHIFPNLAFLINDEIKYVTGAIPQTEQWNKVGFSFTTSLGQESVKLTLRNNAQGGIGNDVALDNISFRACGPRSFVSIESDKTIYKCKDSKPFNLKAEIADPGQFVLWQTSMDGKNWVELTKGKVFEITHDRFVPGSYYYRYLTAGDESNILNEKCRVISDQVLVEVVKDIYEMYDTVCVGNQYAFGNLMLEATGDYTHTFVSSLGCDSTVNLHLKMVDKSGLATNAQFFDPKCFGEQTGSIEEFQPIGGYPPYEIKVKNASGATITQYNQLFSGKYTITIKDRHSCSNAEEIELIDPELFFVVGINDTILELGEEIMLSINSNYNIDNVRWDSPNFSTQEIEPIYIPKTSSALYLFAFNDNKCQATDTINIGINKNYLISYPNIIVPFGSAENGDFSFKAYNNIVENIISIDIYDRYGNMVEGGTNLAPDYKWNGTSNGKRLGSGVYTFVVEFLLINGETFKKTGSITLVN